MQTTKTLTLDKVLSSPWLEDNFSGRIWENRDKLIRELKQTLSRGIVRGDSLDEMTKALAKQMDTAESRAATLVHTESAHIAAEASLAGYKETGVQCYTFDATLDSKTCSYCGQMDQLQFPLSEQETGVNYPPLHPRCRCTTLPVTGFQIGSKRAARNPETGKTEYVEKGLTYEKWHKKYIEKDAKAPATVAKPKKSATMKVKRAPETLKPEMFPEYLTDKKELKNTKTLMEYVNGCKNADPDVVALYAKMGDMENIRANKIPMKVSHGKNHAVNYHYYTQSGRLADAELVIPKLTGDDLTGQAVTTLHEEMHLMDMFNRADPAKYSGWFSSSNAKLSAFFQKTDTNIADDVSTLFEAFNKECKRITTEIKAESKTAKDALYDQFIAGDMRFSDYRKELKKLEREAEKQIDYQCRNAMGGGVDSFEDIYDALSGGSARANGVVGYGHGTDYYRDIGNRSEETLANYGALAIVRPDLVDMLRNDKPELVEALDEVIREMLKKAGG